MKIYDPVFQDAVSPGTKDSIKMGASVLVVMFAAQKSDQKKFLMKEKNPLSFLCLFRTSSHWYSDVSECSSEKDEKKKELFSFGNSGRSHTRLFFFLSVTP